jgi:hypothetical protein
MEEMSEWAACGKWLPVTDQNFAVFEARLADLASKTHGLGVKLPDSYRDSCRSARINPASLNDDEIKGFFQSAYLWDYDYRNKGDGPREIATFLSQAMTYCQEIGHVRWPGVFLKSRDAIQRHPAMGEDGYPRALDS